MGGEICYKKGEQRGPWYEIKCTQDVVRNKEARGEDASFERALLKSWSKYQGYEDAEKGLSALL